MKLHRILLSRAGFLAGILVCALAFPAFADDRLGVLFERPVVLSGADDSQTRDGQEASPDIEQDTDEDC